MRDFLYLDVSLALGFLLGHFSRLTCKVDPRVLGHKCRSVALKVGLRRFDGLMAQRVANNVNALLVAQHRHREGMS